MRHVWWSKKYATNFRNFVMKSTSFQNFFVNSLSYESAIK